MMNTSLKFKILSICITLQVLMCLLVISVPGEAKPDTTKALRHVLRAAKKTDTGKEFIDRNKYKADIQLKKATEFVGDNDIALAVAGVATKLIIDGKFLYKSKLTRDTHYHVDLDISGEISSGISGKIYNYKKTNYDLTTYSKSGDQGIRAGIKFRFD